MRYKCRSTWNSGGIEKLILCFKEKFWGDASVGAVLDVNDPKKAPILFSSLESVKPCAMIVWIVEPGPVDALKIAETIARAFGSSSSLESHEKTSWCSDPFARGTYSLPGLTPVSRTDWTAWHCGRTILAGEYLHPRYWGCVHGAIESGVHAAERVLQALDDNKSHL